MFNFTTTTVINSSDKFLSGTDSLLVKFNNINLKKDNVEAIYHSAYSEAVNDKATVTLPNIAGSFRLKIYISLDGNNNSYYSNDMVYKGKPLYIEFDGKATATDIAKIAKKYQLLLMEKPILKFGGSGTSLTINAVDEYQRITKCVVEKFDETKGQVAGTGNLGMFVEYPTANVSITSGHVGKGTYEQILKDLRLPTGANTRWTSPNADEMPILKGKYDQYTIYYCVNRGILGSDAVGDMVKSRTCHVFFVENSVLSDFKEALVKIGTVTESGTSVVEDAKPIESAKTQEQANVKDQKSVLA